MTSVVLPDGDLSETPLLPHDEGGPTFAEPWEATAFSLAVNLQKQGVFTWKEWCKALNVQILHAQSEGDLDRGDTYYHHWLAALEKMVADKNVASHNTLSAALEDWRAADEHRAFGEAHVLVKGAGEHRHDH